MGDLDTLTVAEYLRAAMVAPLALSALPAPAGDVRSRTGLCFPDAIPAASGTFSQRMDTLDQHHGDQCRHRRARRRRDLAPGIGSFLLLHLPVAILAASIGVWLFYVQHQFEQTSWDHNQKWDMHEAALHGSSHYDLPSVLGWFTANIGIHHIHHLASRIPTIGLPQVLRDHPELKQVGRITPLERASAACVSVLWDERRKRLIPFREISAAA